MHSIDLLNIPIAHCEIKISQNLAHLEANSHLDFSNLTECSDHLNTFYEEINIHHTLLCLSQASYI